MPKLNVAVIYGSRSCEHEVSVVSALQLMEAADSEQYNIVPVYITKEGLWYTGDALRKIETYRNFNPMSAGLKRIVFDLTTGAGDIWEWPPQRTGLFSKLQKPLVRLDCAIPVLHGLHGEDGTVQGLLELLNIPYTSTGVLGSSLGMDKIAVKLLLRGAGYPVLDFIWFTREQWERDAQKWIDRIETQLKYPVFVKPSSLGSSIGISKATDRASLEEAVRVAASYDSRLLVEAGIEHPTEINCSALGFGESVRTSVCEMPVPSSDDQFLTFWEKYLRNSGSKNPESRGMKNLSRVLPAPIGETLTETIQKMTEEIFRLLNCKGVVRIDYIIDENDILYVNEPNTIPGSMAFYLWKASGLSFSQLVDEMVKNAFEASAEKNKSVFAYDSTILDKVISGAKGSKLK